MSSAYVYRKPVRRSKYKKLRNYILFLILLVGIILGVAVYVYDGLHANKDVKPVSNQEISVITGNKKTFVGPYFQFNDTGDWVLDKAQSTANKFTYIKYRGLTHEHQMSIYINHMPPSTDLIATRVLPVRLVNSNSFQVTGVSSSCSTAYKKGEPLNIKEVTISGATIICSPDLNQYIVVISEISGSYVMTMKRPDGTSMQVIITYRDLGLTPTDESIMNIARSFKAL
jgi:hypothetical protein